MNKTLPIQLALLLIVFTFSQCRKDERKPEELQTTIEFKLDLNQKKTTSNYGLTSVVVSIEDNHGNLVKNMESIDLYNMSGHYISTPLPLAVGEYKLTKFLVLNGLNEVVYAAPTEGSTKEDLVEMSLPISFTAQEDMVEKITPQVVSVSDCTPEDFGYTSFSFEVAGTFNFLIGAFIYDEASQNYTMTSAGIVVKSENNVIFSSELEANSNVTPNNYDSVEVTQKIAIPEKYSNYTIELIKLGYKTYRKTLTKEELRLHYAKEDNGPLVALLEVSDTDSCLVDAGPDQFVTSDSAYMDATIAEVGQGTWSIINGNATIAEINNPKTIITDIQPGTELVLRWTYTLAGESCYDDVSVNLSICNGLIDAGPDQFIDSDSTYMAATSPEEGSGTWTVISGFANIAEANNPNTLITGITKGTNATLRWTYTIGGETCYDDVVIANDDCIGVEFVVNPTEQRWPLNLIEVLYDSNEHADSIVIDFGDGSSKLGEVVGGYRTIRHTYSTWGTFYITVGIYIEGVPSYCTKSIEILEGYGCNAYAGSDQTIYTNSTFLNAQPLPANSEGYWEVLQGSVEFASMNYNTEITNIAEGENILIWNVSEDDCSASDTVIITYDKCGFKPYFELADSTVNWPDNTVEIINISSSSSYANYIWDFGDGSPSEVHEQTSTISHSYNASGTYTITLFVESETGCSESYQRTFTIKQNEDCTTNAGQDFVVSGSNISLNAQTLRPDETGSWSIISGSGRFDDVNSPSTPVSDLSMGRNIFVWQLTTEDNCIATDTVEVAYIQARVGDDFSVCSSNVTINAQPINIGTGTWSVISGAGSFDSPNLYSTQVTNMLEGANTYRWTVTYNGSSSYDDITITNNSINTSAGVDQIVEVDNTVLDAILSYGETGTWQLHSGSASIINPNDPKTPVFDLDFGINTFVWTTTKDGCTATDTVNVGYSHFLVYAGVDTTICNNTVTLLAADPYPGSGSWSLVSGTGTISNPNERITQVTDIELGSQNIYRWTVIGNGFTEYDDVIVTSAGFIPFAGEDATTTDTYYTLSAELSAGSTGVWQGGGTNVVFDDPNDPNTTVRNLQIGNNRFSWTVTNQAGCTHTAIVGVQRIE